MNYFDDENKIIEDFQCLSDRESTLLMSDNDELKLIYKSIVDKDNWKKWIDSSAKDAPPPDFFNDELKLMMEVMRVDDHAHEGKKKGNIINPTNARESQIYRELLNRCPALGGNNVDVIVIAGSKLPTEEDHNYEYYKNNFARVINKHKEKINEYKINHPNYKIIFFIMDESSSYFRTSKRQVKSKVFEGKSVFGKLHKWMLDKEFIQCLNDSEIDYLIWYTPYKVVIGRKGTRPLSNTFLYDIKDLSFRLKKYNPNLMISTEV